MTRAIIEQKVEDPRGGAYRARTTFVPRFAVASCDTLSLRRLGPLRW